MLTCTLRDKKYSIDFVSGRALRELEPAAQMYGKVVSLADKAAKGESVSEDAKFTISEAMDTMIRWFCILFQNQFTPDEVLDNYPVDRLMHDIALALIAVKGWKPRGLPSRLRRPPTVESKIRARRRGQTTDVLSDFPTMAAKENQTATLEMPKAP